MYFYRFLTFCKCYACISTNNNVAGIATVYWKWKVKVKVAQLCPAPCDPMDYAVYGILQARILERVAFPFSRRSSQPRDQTQAFRIADAFFTSWATREAQLSTSNYK